MTLVLDAGALIALERNDAEIWHRITQAWALDDAVVTHAGVLGQVWRGDARQARLAQALVGVDVFSLDPDLGRGAGWLLGRAGMSDVIDAALVFLSLDGDTILTSDPEDLAALAVACGRDISVVPV
ncbi:MAG: twitching motility protein PilT [Acidimicrobiales bacterium]